MENTNNSAHPLSLKKFYFLEIITTLTIILNAKRFQFETPFLSFNEGQSKKIYILGFKYPTTPNLQ